LLDQAVEQRTQLCALVAILVLATSQAKTAIQVPSENEDLPFGALQRLRQRRIIGSRVDDKGNPLRLFDAPAVSSGFC